MKEPIQKASPKSDYKPFFQHILNRIQSSSYEMLMAVSKQTLLLYWEIGRIVSEKIVLAGWGKSVVEQLAKDLQTEIPGVRGFSARNIRSMKRFYEFYAQFGINADTKDCNLATAVAELENQEKKPNVNSATTVAEMQKRVYELIIDKE